jgi:hypothetical protein
MKFEVSAIDNFKKESKRLLRKYPSLRNEIEVLADELAVNPEMGTPLGQGFYKIRMAIQSKSKGKRGGARVITFVKVTAETVYLVSIYDKSEQSDISIADLRNLIVG